MAGHSRRQEQRGARRAKDADPKNISPTTGAATATDATATRATAARVTSSRAAATLGETIARTNALPGRLKATATQTRATPRAAKGDTPETPTAAPPTSPSERMPALVDALGARSVALSDVSSAPGVLIRGAAKPPRPALHIVPRRHGPRSAAAQFFGSMVVAIAFLGAVALATPLGQTTGLTSAFQAYASGIPFIPTPTPTPKSAPQTPVFAGPPHEADPGKQAIVNEIVAVFGPYAQGALNVARCESGYDPNARNPYAIGNSHASGVFQILYPSTWDGTSYASYSPYDANANIHAAHEIFQRDGNSWREWQCQP